MSAGFTDILESDRFVMIVAGLQNFRMADFIKMLEKKKGKNVGNVLPFVRGLRFSALLIYAIRELVNHTDLEVSWGHILDDNGEYCSRECDIIIHKKGCVGRWNGMSGEKGSVMDFKFIDYENAVAIISCKSFLSRTEIENDYCADMKKYVKKVWLFAECCGPKSVDKIKNDAKKHGYDYFWNLYTYNKKSGEVVNNINGWNHFVKTIKGLK